MRVLGQIHEVAVLFKIDLLNEICEMIQSGNYDIQEIYEFCQDKIEELKEI